MGNTWWGVETSTSQVKKIRAWHTVGTTHVEIIRSPTLRLTKTRRLEPKLSNLDSSAQRTDFHRCNVHCSCFLAQSSLFLLLVSFNSVSLQQFDHEDLIHTVSSKQLMLRCLLLELNEAFIWSAISEDGNSNELILCSRGNSRSSFPVMVLMWASFIITLCGFSDCTWRNGQNSWNVPDWLTFMS